jgi:predicted DNA-binding mobile mystery protein A
MSSSSLSRLRLTQVERALEPFTQVAGRTTPTSGWLRSIRESLGRSIRTQAALLGLAPATLQQSERSEAQDRISLGQLRKLADGLDCELVYALVPKKPLHDMVEDRARYLAVQEVGGVEHTMALEGQRPSDAFLERKVRERQEELLAGAWNRLWR